MDKWQALKDFIEKESKRYAKDITNFDFVSDYQRMVLNTVKREMKRLEKKETEDYLFNVHVGE